MTDSALRTWTIRWLLAVAAVHVVIGGLLPWIATSGVFDLYHAGVTSAFWPGAAPAQARGMQAWWLSLFGPTVLLMALWMIALIHLADRLRYARIWLWMVGGLLLWAPQDMLVSLRADYWPHVWIDLLALLAMVPPLLWLWRHDRAAMRVEQA